MLLLVVVTMIYHYNHILDLKELFIIYGVIIVLVILLYTFL